MVKERVLLSDSSRVTELAMRLVVLRVPTLDSCLELCSKLYLACST